MTKISAILIKFSEKNKSIPRKKKQNRWSLFSQFFRIRRFWLPQTLHLVDHHLVPFPYLVQFELEPQITDLVGVMGGVSWVRSFATTCGISCWGVEGFGVITDYLVIEMGWVILNIVSKFLSANYWQDQAARCRFLQRLTHFVCLKHIHQDNLHQNTWKV